MKRFAVTAITGLFLAGCTAASFAQTPAPAPAKGPLAESVPSDLPRVARPSHYRIEVVPDAASMTFTGVSSIDVEVFRQTDTLTLHANELEFSTARLFAADGRGEGIALETTLDPSTQTVQLRAPRPIAPGTYRLAFAYSGKINTQATGLFALDYPDKRTGETVRGLFTQFEAPDARRFAPMFDEPSYKATFDLSAIVPANQMAVSNMPVAREEALAGGARKRVTFGTTPTMSSYLLFFAVGDFERLATKGPGGIDVGIVSPSGSGEQARLALESTPQILEYYTDYFGVPFPLPKLDNVAAPGQSQFFGAMENWGAILTFEKYLLIDPTITDPATQNYQYTALAHEIAHQWFGDIVTMAWWDDLWLNEGFASWMETKASARFRPDWYPLMTRVNGRETAMGYDAFATTHPVVQQIRTVSETPQAFDAISYSKGEAVIAMLEAYAGEDTWRDGIRAYIREHRYGNTTSDDLWRAVEAAGATGLTEIAHDFTLKPGVPLVRAESVCREGKTLLSLTQGEFSRDRKDETASGPQHWRVPLLIDAGASEGGPEPVRRVLDGSATVELAGCGPMIVNGGQLGYFRTLYSPAMSSALVEALPGFAPIDQLGLLRDGFALAEAGYQPTERALDLLAAVPGNANAIVAQGALARWNRVHDLAPEASKPAVAALARNAWLPRLRELGFDPRPGESLVDTDLRGDLLRILGRMGDETVAAEARRRFAALAADPKSLDGPLKTTWLGIVARNATAAEWDRLVELAANAPSAVERQVYFTLLGAAKDKALAQKALDLALTGKAGTTSAAIISAVAQPNPDLAFDFAISNRAKVEDLVDASGRAGYLAGLAAASRDPEMIDKLERFRGTLPADEWREVDRRKAGIRERLATEPRLASEIGEWLARR